MGATDLSDRTHGSLMSQTVRGRPVRVLHVIQNLNYGGMERLLADIVRRCDPALVESHVVCLQYIGRFGEDLGDIAGVHLAEPLPRYSMLWPGPLIRQIRALAPDVVHTHSGVWYKASFAARRAGVGRVMHTEHGRAHPDPFASRVVDGLAARNTDIVVAVSGLLGEQLVDRRIARRDQVRVIPNGVDTDLFRPRPDEGSPLSVLDIPADTPIIGSIGRLELIKGYDVMVDAFAILRARWEGEHAPVLVVGGEGSQRPELLRRAAAQGVQDSIYFLGWRDDIHELHAAFDLFTMSSRSEGTSVSLLEAMSAELCPVVTDVGGNAAVLGPELQHRLVPAEDAPALAAAWLDALRDGCRRAQDAKTARMRVKDDYGLEAMVRRYQALYVGAGG